MYLTDWNNFSVNNSDSNERYLSGSCRAGEWPENFRPEWEANPDKGPVSQKSRELFGPEKPVVKLQSTRFRKLTIQHLFNVRKTKKTAKFDGLEPRRSEDIEGIEAPEIAPESFGTFEKQARESWNFRTSVSPLL